jgi:hypothetical protein
MMLDWNDYRKQLAVGVKEVGQLSPDTIKGYIELGSAGQKKDCSERKSASLLLSRSPLRHAATAVSRSMPKLLFATAQPGKRLPKRWASQLRQMQGRRSSTPRA